VVTLAKMATAKPKRSPKPTAKVASARSRPEAANSLRKKPLQERSRLRLERILAAGEKEFADEGYDGATMEKIAERAGTSIGSVYQFFPDKRALFRSVAERYESDSRDYFAKLIFEAQPGMSVDELIDYALEGVWTFMRQGDGLRAVWLNGLLSRELLELAGAMNEKSAEVLSQLLAARAPKLPRARRELVARFTIDLVGSMLFVAARNPAATGEKIIEELKLNVKAYLGRVLG
jgi:AcrR family transcriptional regulator